MQDIVYYLIRGVSTTLLLLVAFFVVSGPLRYLGVYNPPEWDSGTVRPCKTVRWGICTISQGVWIALFIVAFAVTALTVLGLVVTELGMQIL